MILAGDIGGTKTVLALFDGRTGPLMPVREATLASRQYARFEDVLQTFLGDRAPGAIAAACFGVAGPVVDGRVVTTRSEEHTSELQSHSDLVCRLLLEKKKTIHQSNHVHRTGPD